MKSEYIEEADEETQRQIDEYERGEEERKAAGIPDEILPPIIKKQKIDPEPSEDLSL
jgi:hypothetical protein